MSPRPNVSGERKFEILNAAESVFTRNGFDAARMEDIAEESGLSKAALYLYFKSKDDLILAMLDRIFQGEFKRLENVIRDEVRATDALWKLIDIMTQDILGMLRLIPIVYNFLALAFRNKYVQRTLKAYLNSYIDILVPIIQRGVDTGEFRPVDAQEAAIAMGAVIEGTLLLWVYDNKLVDPKTHIRSGMQLLLEGLQART
jgi:AcrR family transcriptional regulator